MQLNTSYLVENVTGQLNDTYYAIPVYNRSNSSEREIVNVVHKNSCFYVQNSETAR